MNKHMDAKYLRSIIRYDHESGVLYWNCNRCKTKIGDVAGTKTDRGYISVCIDRKRYRGHRLAWLHYFGEWPSMQIDHVNGDRSDNSIKNLRECTQFENSQNMAFSSKKASKYPGVHFHAKTGKWRSAIRIDGNSRKYLGLFKTEQEAADAYSKAKMDAHKFNPEVTERRV